MEQGVLTEQRTNIKFLMKLCKSRREIIEMLETVYGESTIKRRTVYKWMDQFKEGQESVDDNAQEGRPSTSRVGENIQRVHNLMMSDCRITTRIITDKLGISKGSVQTILKEDLNMWKLCAKIFLKVLTQEQNDDMLHVANTGWRMGGFQFLAKGDNWR
jgi:transposase